MSKERSITDYSRKQLRELFTSAGLREEDVEKAIEDYSTYRKGELSELSLLSMEGYKGLGGEVYAEHILTLREGTEIVYDILKEYLHYIDYKSKIDQTYRETEDWYQVLNNHVYTDVWEANEAFIDYIEETYNTKIKDVDHLQELTGITHFSSYWKGGEQVEITKEEEQKKEAKKQLQDSLIKCRESKYIRALENAIREGATYKDLLKIKPQDFNLPEKWEGSLYRDQKSAIDWAINMEYSVDEPAGLMMFPSLRLIAEDLEAPYSVIMDIYRRYNFKTSDRSRAKEIKQEIRVTFLPKFKKFIKDKGKAWRKEWLSEGVADIGDNSGIVWDLREHYLTGITEVALATVTNREPKCGAEIAEDIKTYFKEELDIYLKYLKHGNSRD